jgi:hypothetical protein
MTQRTQRRVGGILALTIALSATAAPASARTFDFNSSGSMTQQLLPGDFACAMRRAQDDRIVPCRAIQADHAVAAHGRHAN